MADLRGGGSSPSEFAGSMGAAIEDELNKLLGHDGKAQLPSDGSTQVARDRRRFVAAVARGVIRHLEENPDALEVVFTQVPSPHSTGDFKARVQVQWGDEVL